MRDYNNGVDTTKTESVLRVLEGFHVERDSVEILELFLVVLGYGNQKSKDVMQRLRNADYKRGSIASIKR